MQNEQFFTLRSMFYLLKPSETYIENAKDVPDLTAKAVPVYYYFLAWFLLNKYFM